MQQVLQIHSEFGASSSGGSMHSECTATLQYSQSTSRPPSLQISHLLLWASVHLSVTTCAMASKKRPAPTTPKPLWKTLCPENPDAEGWFYCTAADCPSDFKCRNPKFFKLHALTDHRRDSSGGVSSKKRVKRRKKQFVLNLKTLAAYSGTTLNLPAMIVAVQYPRECRFSNLYILQLLGPTGTRIRCTRWVSASETGVMGNAGNSVSRSAP